MQKLTVKRAIGFGWPGAPSTELVQLPAPAQVAVLPERIAHIKPRLRVKKETRSESDLFSLKTSATRVLSSCRLEVEPFATSCSDPGASSSPLSLIGSPSGTRRAFPRSDGIGTGTDWPWSTDRPNPQRRHVVGLPGAAFQGFAGARHGTAAHYGKYRCQGAFQAAPEVYLKEQEQLLAYGLKALNVLAPRQGGGLRRPRRNGACPQDGPILDTHRRRQLSQRRSGSRALSD